MKGRYSLIIMLLTFSVAAGAQTVESIRSSTDYLWADGRDVRPSVADNKAIDNLLTRLAATDILPVEEWVKGELWKTYRTDLRNSTQALTTPNGVLRYIAWRDIDKIFGNRWRKVHELVRSAQKSAHHDPDAARTYLFWAETYMASLPSADSELTKEAAAVKAVVGPGRTDAVHLRNIENEIGLILNALRQQKPVVKEVLQTEGSLQQEEFRPAERDTVLAIKSLNLTSFLQWLQVVPGKLPVGTIAMRAVSPRPVVVPKASWNIALLLQADFWKTPSFGVMFVAGYGKIGAYISARTNFTSNAFAYECRQDGSCDYGRFWASGNSRSHRLSIAAGPVYSFHKQFLVYAGVGYGQQSILWEDSDGTWARVSDLSTRGVLLDAGVLWSPGRFIVGLGASLTAFRVPSGVVSVGVSF